MKGYILYDKEGLARNRSFAEAIISHAKKSGVTIDLLLREDVLCSMKNSSLSLMTKNGSIIFGDFIINRCIDPMFAEFCEKCGFRVFNSAEVCRIFNDKRLTHMYFAGKGIPMADSCFLNRYDGNYEDDDFPKIIKSPSGHGGSEVFLVKDQTELELVSQKYSDRLIQSPVKDLGLDLRVYVLEGEILCSVLRSSKKDFRSNFSLGGSCDIYTPSKDEEELIRKVISAMPKGALYVGIDFIFNNGKPYLNEIEDIVGSRMLYAKTDIYIHEIFTSSVINQMNKEINHGK